MMPANDFRRRWRPALPRQPRCERRYAIRSRRRRPARSRVLRLLWIRLRTPPPEARARIALVLSAVLIRNCLL